jgi:hypothetical protein
VIAFAQPGVRLCLTLGKLRFQPAVQLLHHRAAMLLMKLQPLLRRQGLRPRFSIVTIHVA